MAAKKFDKKEFIDRLEFAMIAHFDGKIKTEIRNKYNHECVLALHPIESTPTRQHFAFDINKLWDVYQMPDATIDIIIRGMQNYIDCNIREVNNGIS